MFSHSVIGKGFTRKKRKENLSSCCVGDVERFDVTSLWNIFLSVC